MKEMRNVFPDVPESFHSRLVGTLEGLQSERAVSTENKEGFIMKSTKSRGFRAMRMAAAAIAATVALTIGVGAATGWNYGNVFGLLFGSGNDVEAELHGMGNRLMPEVTNMANSSENLDLEILGIAGDDRNIHVIAKLTPKNGYVPNLDHYMLSMRGFTPLVGELEPGVSMGFGVGELQLLSEDESGMIISVQLSYTSSNIFDNNQVNGLEEGYLHMAFVYWEHCFDSGFIGDQETHMTFDLLVDYDFSISRKVEVNESVTLYGSTALLKAIEITPISVRYSYIVNDINLRRHTFEPVTITFKNGDTLSSCEHSMASGHGTDNFMTDNVPFTTPFDVNEVYSVTIGDNTFVI
jgi:hypothetical protein